MKKSLIMFLILAPLSFAHANHTANYYPVNTQEQIDALAQIGLTSNDVHLPLIPECRIDKKICKAVYCPASNQYMNFDGTFPYYNTTLHCSDTPQIEAPDYAPYPQAWLGQLSGTNPEYDLFKWLDAQKVASTSETTPSVGGSSGSTSGSSSSVQISQLIASTTDIQTSVVATGTQATVESLQKLMLSLLQQVISLLLILQQKQI